MAKKPARKNIVGRRVAQARQRSNPALTQDAPSGRLARLGIQLDRAAVAKIENNHRHVLDYELKALADVLDVDADGLLGVKGDERPDDPATLRHAVGQVGRCEQIGQYVSSRTEPEHQPGLAPQGRR